MGSIAIPSSGGTAPTVAYRTSGTSRVNGFNKTFTLPKGYYYLNMHFNSGSGRVIGDTTWTFTGATRVYVNNGTGNYGCNALYQGLIYSDGSPITLSSTNNNTNSSWPYELVAYKV